MNKPYPPEIPASNSIKDSLTNFGRIAADASGGLGGGTGLRKHEGNQAENDRREAA